MNTNILKTAIAALALLVAFNSCKEEKTKFHIEVACDPEQGTITGGGEYEEGEKATLTAIANPGYYFARWVGDYKSEDSVLTITVTANKSLSAIFGKIESSEYGSVKITISEGGTYYLYEASPNENCYFVKWSDGSYELSKKVDVSAVEKLTATFKPYPEGSIHALFFVSPTKRVIFSKGYLQFNPSLGTHTRADGTTAPGTWRFAEQQTDFITGDTIVNATYDGWIDDFAWGSSGWSGSGATYYQPYDGYCNGWYLPYVAFDFSLSPEIIEKIDFVANQFGPQGEYDLTGEYAYADWGVYNPISNGGNEPGMWRTLSNNEFRYFLNTYHFVQPDQVSYWFFNEENPIFEKDESDNSEKEINTKNSVFFYSTFGLDIWTSTAYENGSAYIIHIPNMSNEKRALRQPVRLVMDVEE